MRRFTPSLFETHYYNNVARVLIRYLPDAERLPLSCASSVAIKVFLSKILSMVNDQLLYRATERVLVTSLYGIFK